HAELRRDARPGLLALAHRARERRDELYGSLSRKWLGDHTKTLVELCRALAERLGAETLATESRRFALRSWPAPPEGTEEIEIEEGVLRIGRVELVLRRISEGGTIRSFCILTWDQGDGDVDIDEAPIDEGRFDALWELTERRRRARSVRISANDCLWEIKADDASAVAVPRWPRATTAPHPPP